MLNSNLLFYPLPIISVSKNGLVKDKNYSVDSAFSVVHIGASASKYTDIPFDTEQLSRGLFCNKECTYCTFFEGDETILILSQESFGTFNLSERLFDEYKKKVKDFSGLPLETVKKSQKKYAKSVNDKMIRANYFSEYHQLFDKRLKRPPTFDESAFLSKICLGIKNATLNYFDQFSVNFNIDYECGNIVVNTDENNIINIILNTLSFCVINAEKDINVSLKSTIDTALLSFNFQSNASFDKWLNPEDDSILNSSLSLVVATEIAKLLGYEYTITREPYNQKLNNYTLLYKLTARITASLPMSSHDNIAHVVDDLLSLIFFDEIN